MPDTASGMPSSATVKLVLTVLFLLIAILFVTNPDFRIWANQTMADVYSKLTCLFGFGCIAGDDDQTAIDSTKALACAIDATAYWSDTSDPKRATALAELLKRIDNPDAICKDCHSEVSKNPPTLFRDTNGNWIGGCKEGTSTPTGVAVGARTGGIISALSELSGGGNRITGNVVAQSGSCDTSAEGTVFYVNADKTSTKTCGTKILTDAGHKVCDPASGCLEVPCPDCKKGGLLDPCPKEECAAISNTQKYGQCKWTEGITGNECKLTQTKAQAKAASFTDADAIVRENPGKAVRFGKTAVLCGKGGTDLRCCKLKAGAVTTYYYEDGGCSDKSSCLIGCSVEEVAMSNCGGVSKPENLVCNVKAFELPQRVYLSSTDSPWPQKAIGSTIDFGRAWIGAMGDPHYLVYYETFPKEAEEAWMYSGWDVLLTSFATGAVLNLGLGGVKVAATGVKAGGLYVVKNAGLTVKSMVGFEVKAAERELLKTELERTMSARLAKEFGGGALMRMGAAKATEQKMVMESVSEAYSKITQKQIEERLEAAEVKLMEKTAEKELGELELLVSGESEITEDVLKKIAPELTDEEISTATNTLRNAQSDRRAGKLVGKNELRDKTLEIAGSKEKYAAEFKDTYKKMEAGLGRAAKSTTGILGAPEKAGIISSINWVAKKIFNLKTPEPLDKLANEMAEANFERMTSKMASRLDEFESATVALGGETISASSPGLKGVGKQIDIEKVVKDADFGNDVANDEFKAMLAAWNNLDDPVVKSSIWERAGTLVKMYSGTPAMDKIPSFKRQVVMATSITLSYLYMMEESKAEKYLVSKNSIVLTWPMMWTFLMKNPDDPANYKKEPLKTPNLGTDTWMQMKIPAVFGEGGMPLYLASPCKADIDITKGTCKCKVYSGGDRVLVRFSTIGTRTVDMDGPITQTFSESPNDLVETFPGGKLATTIKEYIGDPGSGEEKSPMLKDILAEAKERNKTAQEKCNEPFVTECNLNVIAVPVNIGPAVSGGYETHKVCTEEGWLDWLITAGEKYERPCIQLSVDSASMREYALDSGYSSNFCRMNNGKASDMAQVGIEAGVAIGSIAMTLFPPTTAVGTALILGVGGGMGAVGTKYLDITSKWPESQY